MKMPRLQRGLGLFGLIFLLSLIGFVALVLIKCVPLYMNQMTIKRDLHEVADHASSTGSDTDLADVHREVERRWDIDYVSQLEAKDVKVGRTRMGLTISYDYEARAHLFANVYVVMHFAEDIPVKPSRSVG
ncbi:MAG: DUF4845 domain-containing protein [Nevskia sp.]|nr:DUF4845 domain-containing protein [Nevskia sp.]